MNQENNYITWNFKLKLNFEIEVKSQFEVAFWSWFEFSFKVAFRNRVEFLFQGGLFVSWIPFHFLSPVFLEFYFTSRIPYQFINPVFFHEFVTSFGWNLLWYRIFTYIHENRAIADGDRIDDMIRKSIS